jgi:light-regulated signal transduction histidine kinase (bacteriophytochrome)
MNQDASPEQLKRLWAAASRDIDMYMYAVSHDLRTSVFVVDSFSKLLQDEYGEGLDDTASTFIANIRKSTQAMTQLIEDLLALARLSTADVSFQTVDISGLAAQVIEELRGSVPDRQVAVEIQSGISLVSDHDLMKRVLQEIIGNAWKFTSRTASPKIEIACKQQQTGTLVSIRDNGAGFDPQYADRLFVPFKKLQADFEGRGVGLARVQRIIDLLDGKVWAEAEPGKGAVFHIAFESR